MAKIYAEFSRIRCTGDINGLVVQRVELLADIFYELDEKVPEPPFDAETETIKRMIRS